MDKKLIFKTSDGEYIGYNKEPNEDYTKSLAYGLDYTIKPDGNVISTYKNLILIENPRLDISSLKDFDENYTDVTKSIKLIKTKTNFSPDVKILINDESSAKKASAKKTPAKKASAKKAPAKKASAKKKGGAKKSKKKASAKKKGGAKKSKKKSKKN